MNNKRRQEIRKNIESLSVISNNIDIILDEESDCLDNMPENLEGSERYEAMENAVDSLSDAVDKIEEVIGCLNDAI